MNNNKQVLKRESKKSSCLELLRLSRLRLKPVCSKSELIETQDTTATLKENGPGLFEAFRKVTNCNGQGM